MTEAEAKINECAESLGLTMTAEFVPWSKSRNAGEKQPSLNWKVTLSNARRDYRCACGKEWTRPVRLSEHTPNVSGEATEYCPECKVKWLSASPVRGGAFLTTDYGAGCGRCPSYEQRATIHSAAAVKWECENGTKAIGEVSTGFHSGNRMALKPQPILPNLADVLHSLVSDAEAIDYPTYEEWADNLGFDRDSRKGEAAYRACLESGLKLRAALGEEGLRRLREACEGY